jgi:pilus assembly protein Flp/PilA
MRLLVPDSREIMSMQSPVAVAALKKLAEARRFRRSEDGQDLLEYGLLAALIAIIALGAVSAVGNTINQVFWQTIAINF